MSKKSVLRNLWQAEPVLIMAFVRSVMLLLVVFGVALTPDKIAAIMVVVETGLAIVTRAMVASPAKVEKIKADAAASTREPTA